MRQNILIVEDDSVIAEGLSYALETEGFETMRRQRRRIAQAYQCAEF